MGGAAARSTSTSSARPTGSRARAQRAAWSRRRLARAGARVARRGSGRPRATPSRCSRRARCACSLPMARALPAPRAAAGACRCRSTWRARSSACSSAPPLDFVHVHEPFAPSAAAAALRHSRALNVGSFHSPTERVLSTQVARRFIELFFGRLDARMATFERDPRADLALLPRRLRGVRPGVDLERFAPADRRTAPLEIAFVGRGGARRAAALPARAAARCRWTCDWRATVWSRAPATAPARSAAARCASACGSPGRGGAARGQLLARGRRRCARRPPAPRPRAAARAEGDRRRRGAGRVAHPRLRGGAGRRRARACCSSPATPSSLAAQLAAARGRPRAAATSCAAAHRARHPELGWDRVADARRGALPRAWPRAATRPTATPGDAQRLAHGATSSTATCTCTPTTRPTARRPSTCCSTRRSSAGLGAIAVTDHNEISGAHEARERAERDQGDRLRGGQDRPRGRGDRPLHRGEDPARHVAARRRSTRSTRQGGLAYVPHPFDRLHAVPDYEHLLKVVEDIDVLEVFNARVAVAASTRRRSASPPSTGSSRAPARTATWRRDSAR